MKCEGAVLFCSYGTTYYLYTTLFVQEHFYHSGGENSTVGPVKEFQSVLWDSDQTQKNNGCYTSAGSSRNVMRNAVSERKSIAQTTLVTHTSTDEDSNVYLFNQCDENVFIYNEADSRVETFVDDSTFDTTDHLLKVYDFAGLLPTKYLLFSTNYQDYTQPTYYLHYYPKLRMKQEHNTKLSSPTTRYTNLNQLKNGKLIYKSSSDQTYPTFYGGLPLFTGPVANVKKCQFNIKLVPTTSDYTGKMKLWVKEGEFVNSDNFSSSTWTTAEKNKLMKLKAGSATTGSDGSLQIDANTQVTIEFVDLPEKDKTYFLRFCEANKTYGGEIKYLGDCTLEIDS